MEASFILIQMQVGIKATSSETTDSVTKYYTATASEVKYNKITASDGNEYSEDENGLYVDKDGKNILWTGSNLVETTGTKVDGSWGKDS